MAPSERRHAAISVCALPPPYIASRAAACNDQTGIFAREGRLADFVVRDELRPPFDLLVEKARVLSMEQIDGPGVGSTMPGEKVFGLLRVGRDR